MLANTSTPAHTWNPLSQWEDDGGPPPEVPAGGPDACVNVGPFERALSVYAGGSLLMWGLTRRSFPGLFVAAVGGALVYRGTTGHCRLYEALNMTTAEGIPGPSCSTTQVHAQRQAAETQHSAGLQG